MLGMDDALMFSTQGGNATAAARRSESGAASVSASSASPSTAEYREARTRELLHAQSLQRSSASPRTNGSGILGYSARLPLEPLIPSLDGLELDGDADPESDPTPRTQAKQVTALTARLAKLQHYLEAEKAN